MGFVSRHGDEDSPKQVPAVIHSTPLGSGEELYLPLPHQQRERYLRNPRWILRQAGVELRRGSPNGHCGGGDGDVMVTVSIYGGRCLAERRASYARTSLL